VFQIIGPDAATNKRAVLSTSMGDKEQWRDFVLEYEFTLSKGTATMFLRMGRTTEKTEPIEFSTQGDNAFVAGETYDAEISLIGSNLRYVVHSVDFKPVEAPSSWTMSRKGSIGLVIDPETQLKFTKMRIKVLR
jgi:hypothetical protein